MDYPLELQELVEEELGKYCQREEATRLTEAMSYSLLSGGKRFRPVLHLATARSLGKDVRGFLPTACAIEMVHAYSLIHDDLPALDNDDLRRGKPSCHKAFGEDVAIMAGDALFSWAFQVIAEEQRGEDQAIREVLVLLARTTGSQGMVGGQVEDLRAGKEISDASVKEIHLKKTAMLISFCCQSAAVIAGSDSETEALLTDFGLLLGEVFQLVDDLIDYKEGKEEPVNFSRLFGPENARKAAEKKTGKALTLLSRLNRDTKPLEDLAHFCLERTS